MFTRLFRKDPAKTRARELHRDLLAAARRPFLYGPGGAPDTVDGRFDLIVLHAILLFLALRQAGETGQTMSQLVFDIMFDDFGAALREMGTGDMTVGKRIREMGEAFYGRASAYESPLAEADETALAAAIARNMFNDDPACALQAEALAGYALESARLLDGQGADSIMSGSVPRFASGLSG